MSFPSFFKPMTVRDDPSGIRLYALVDMSTAPSRRRVCCYPTMRGFPKIEGDYVGSCERNGEMWHVFVD
jgi:hypothetical protein